MAPPDYVGINARRIASDVEARAIDVRKVCGVFGEDGRQIGRRKDDALRAGVEQRVRQSRQATVVRF